MRRRLRASTPEIPAARINRSTRFRPTRTPCYRRSSAWILLKPWVPSEAAWTCLICSVSHASNSAVRRRATLPVVTAGPVHPQRPAHHRHRKLALSASISAKISPTARRFPGRKSRRLLENLALHPQRLILTTQPRELLTLIAREAIRTLALVALSLLDPIAQRHIRDPRILRDLMLTLARDQNKLDRLPTKLRWIRRLVRGSSAAESARVGDRREVSLASTAKSRSATDSRSGPVR